MLTILHSYGWIILVLVLVVLLGLYFFQVYKKYGKQKMLHELREKTYQLMLLAEKEYGPGEGSKKFTWVAEKVYLLIPTSAKLFVDEADILLFIQECYDLAKDFLDDGKLNKSV